MLDNLPITLRDEGDEVTIKRNPCMCGSCEDLEIQITLEGEDTKVLYVYSDTDNLESLGFVVGMCRLEILRLQQEVSKLEAYYMIK
jgi:hypothetical protein